MRTRLFFDGKWKHASQGTTLIRVVCVGIVVGTTFGCGISVRALKQLEQSSDVTASASSSALWVGVTGYYNGLCGSRGGSVKCWGDNYYWWLDVEDQVGTAAWDSFVGAPSSLADATEYVDFDGGAYHVCGVTKGGGVKCWGANNDGRLGDGTTTDAYAPVVALPDGSGATKVAAGDGTTCAVVNGGVKCWGYNVSGECGNGSTASPVLTHVDTIPAGSGVTDVANGSWHFCAVVAGGVKCWGYNFDGELGNGGGADSSVPVDAIPAGSGVTRISSGQTHTCAVMNGGLVCWGSNWSGQLGLGDTTDRSTPQTVFPAGSGVTEVSAGFYHTCVVVSGGLQCFGGNWDGQLGDGTTVDPRTSPVPVYPAGSGVDKVGSSEVATCIFRNGSLECAGDDSSAQLGQGAKGTYSSSFLPVSF
ncbi:MAG: hypothetical protein JST04_03490 [Bdellovibrionales bacterium]|nr:hypothetical protein [Bdellovibrionales bacterium]